MLDLDTSRAANRLSDLIQIVEAVHNASKEDETDWLEFKSSYDLTNRGD